MKLQPTNFWLWSEKYECDRWINRHQWAKRPLKFIENRCWCFAVGISTQPVDTAIQVLRCDCLVIHEFIIPTSCAMLQVIEQIKYIDQSHTCVNKYNINIFSNTQIAFDWKPLGAAENWGYTVSSIKRSHKLNVYLKWSLWIGHCFDKSTIQKNLTRWNSASYIHLTLRIVGERKGWAKQQWHVWNLGRMWKSTIIISAILNVVSFETLLQICN